MKDVNITLINRFKMLKEWQKNVSILMKNIYLERSKVNFISCKNR